MRTRGKRLLSIFCLLISLSLVLSTTAMADNSEDLLPKPFVNSVFFGTAVGLVLGLALGGGMSGTMRGTSLGFYGGILLGIYVSSRENHNPGPQAETILPPETPDRAFKYLVTFDF